MKTPTTFRPLHSVQYNEEFYLDGEIGHLSQFCDAVTTNGVKTVRVEFRTSGKAPRWLDWDTEVQVIDKK